MNKFHISLIMIIIVFFSACSTRGKSIYKPKHTSKTTYVSEKKVYEHPTMKPYTVMGVKYYPEMVNIGDEFDGKASWYGPDFNGKLTSNGETYNMWEMTAAHKTLPMNTLVRVINLQNDKSTVVRINDRGPFVETRIIDLSKAAAVKIGMVKYGTAPVELEIVGFEKGFKKVIKKQKKQKNNQSNHRYALQIASFSKIEGAISMQEEYDNTDGYKTFIEDVESKNGRLFKVLLKGFKNEKEARDYKKNGIFENAFIIKEDMK